MSLSYPGKHVQGQREKNVGKCRKFCKGKYRYRTDVRGSEFVRSLQHSSASYRKSSCTFFTAQKTISSLLLEINARETAYPVACLICQSIDDLCQSTTVCLVPYCIYIDFHSQQALLISKFSLKPMSLS